MHVTTSDNLEDVPLNGGKKAEKAVRQWTESEEEGNQPRIDGAAPADLLRTAFPLESFSQPL
jgi:hypothetical protein